MNELRKEFVEDIRYGIYGNTVMNELKDFLLEAHDEAKDLERQLEEAREENDKLRNKNTLLAEGNRILTIKEIGDNFSDIQKIISDNTYNLTDTPKDKCE